MNPKELRKKILECLYEKRSEFDVDPSELFERMNVSEPELDMEIRYLEEKGFVRIISSFMGKPYLNFCGVKITANGIDLVEDPDEFNKLFSIKIDTHFGDVHHTEVNVNSKNRNQSIGILNEGNENTFQNIETEGFDIGIHDKGKKTKVINFKGLRKKSKKWWVETLLTIVGGLIVACLVYYFGWN